MKLGRLLLESSILDCFTKKSFSMPAISCSDSTLLSLASKNGSCFCLESNFKNLCAV